VGSQRDGVVGRRSTGPFVIADLVDPILSFLYFRPEMMQLATFAQGLNLIHSCRFRCVFVSNRLRGCAAGRRNCHLEDLAWKGFVQLQSQLPGGGGQRCTL
jgi:hypothetical protein